MSDVGHTPWTACWTSLGRTVVGFHISGRPHGSCDPICEFRAPVGRASAFSEQEIIAFGNLIAAAPDLLAVVLRLEWSAETDMEEGGTEAACPLCDWAKRDGHDPKCRLDAARRKARPTPTDPASTPGDGATS